MHYSICRAYKIYASLLNERLKKEVESKLEEEYSDLGKEEGPWTRYTY